MGAPTLLEQQAAGALQRLNDLMALAATHITGGAITDGGTTQASGANTALNFDADVALVDGLVDNVPFSLAAATDIDSTGGDDIVWGATSGKSVYYAVVITTGAAGTTAAAYDTVHGAVAATASVAKVTEAQIDAALGHTHWVLVGDVLITRTADTAVTFTADMTRRASLGSRITTSTGPSQTKALAETEAEFRDYTTS